MQLPLRPESRTEPPAGVRTRPDMSGYRAQEWMDPEAADGSMGSLIKPEERAEDMGFTLPSSVLC